MSRWVPDSGYTGGSTRAVPLNTITRAAENGAPAGVLVDVREGMSSWERDVVAGRYLIRIYFLDDTSSASAQRVQSVSVNGALLLDGLDIYDETGTASTELVKDVVVSHPGGTMTISWSASTGSTGPIAGHAVIPTTLPLTPPLTPSEPPPDPTTAWSYEFFPNTTLQAPATVVGGEDTIVHQWLSAAPHDGFPADNWSARWTGTFAFDGTYEFHALCDDRVRIKLREAGTTGAYTTVLEYWGDSAPPTDYYSTGLFPAGVDLDGDYEVVVEFVEFLGWAVLEVEWYLAEPLSGVHTFTADDDDPLPEPWDTAVTTGGAAAIGDNAMRLRVTSDGTARHAVAILPAAFTNYRVTGTFVLSDADIAGASVHLRHSGTTAGTDVESYIYEWFPKTSEFGVGKRVVSGTSTYSELSRLPFTFQADTTYNFRFEVQDTDLRMWFGTGAFAGVWSLTYADAGGGVDSPGVDIEFWHACDGTNGSGTRDVFFDNIAIEDLGTPGGGGSTHPVLQGAYTGFGTGGISGWESTVQKASSMPMHYIDTADTSTLSSIYSWLSGNPLRYYMLSLNSLISEPGNFDSSAERSRCQTIATSINNAGYADRVIIRPMYEINANYGFPWQPFSHGNDFEGAMSLWRDIHGIFKGTNTDFQIVWCVVPWDTYDNDLTEVWPGGEYVDFVGLDVYNYFASGNQQQRWATVGNRLNNGILWARNHDKPWSVDEWGNFTEAGDDPYFVEQMLTMGRTEGDCHSMCWFNSGDGGVGQTLGQQTQALARYRQHIALYP